MIFFPSVRTLGLSLALACFSVGAVHAQVATPLLEVAEVFEQGVGAFQAGQMADARLLWSGLLERHPGRPELLNNLAVLYSRSGDLQQAGQLLAKAAATPPHYASIALNLQRFKAPGDTPPDLVLLTEWPRPGVTVSELGPALARRQPSQIGDLMASVKRAEQQRLGLPDDWLLAPSPAVPAATDATDPSPVGAGIVDAELAQALQRWMISWERRDVPSYLSWYAAGFRPASGMTRADWAKQRHARLAAAKQIELSVEITRTEPGPLPGSQWLYTSQRYKSAAFKEVSGKAMLWVKTPEGWRILRELPGPSAKGG